MGSIISFSKKSIRIYNYSSIITNILINNNPHITISINEFYNSKNVLGRQQIRITENGNLKELISFFESKEILIYEFENNSLLYFIKNKNNILLRIVDLDTNTDMIIEMCPSIRNNFKNPPGNLS